MCGRENNNGLKPVIGVRPDGSPILSPNDLPFLPVPRSIVVEKGWMQIDEYSSCDFTCDFTCDLRVGLSLTGCCLFFRMHGQADEKVG